MTKRASERKYGKGRTAKRLTAFVLAAALCFGLLPMVSPPAEAADWMEPYLEQVVEWGVMRGDASGNLNPDRQITRAGIRKQGQIPLQTYRTMPGTQRIFALPAGRATLTEHLPPRLRQMLW